MFANDPRYKNIPGAGLFERVEVEALKMIDRSHEEKEEDRAQKVIIEHLNKFRPYTEEGSKRVGFVANILRKCFPYTLGGWSHCRSMEKYRYKKDISSCWRI